MEKFTVLEGVAAPLKMINVDTDMIIPKQYLKTIKRTGLGKGLFSEKRFRDDGSENPDFVLNKPAYRKAQDSRRRRQFRLRLLARARALGADGFRHHLRDLDLVRRHFLQQLLQERRAADQGVAGRPGKAVRRRRARRQCDAHRRSGEAGNPRPRRRRGQIRHRPAPQALPAQRPRRHRPDHAQGSKIEGFEEKAKAARPWV